MFGRIVLDHRPNRRSRTVKLRAWIDVAQIIGHTGKPADFRFGSKNLSFYGKNPQKTTCQTIDNVSLQHLLTIKIFKGQK